MAETIVIMYADSLVIMLEVRPHAQGQQHCPGVIRRTYMSPAQSSSNVP